ncbi:hypothetical protein BU24DRAFT_422565 [Aaosphaeria arxii CBS 175.79]|uniref:Uncharacterized protein n=1 Tax=Aaosphaeria arxii CBS 175.79 TaxID=1450172 RepID=A0A6A5XTS3_9PLEO|nr:uncharacterized protein BU24DRAFT_422565 [Aaosphaeria arxii CBS 175.79]KAF2016217.1 hypothetical protein BU24DRAFT_422565 [Aaosphaeria arxii CBS 175.79]
MADSSAVVLKQLSDHLLQIDQDPTTNLDTELLEQCELFTSTSEYRTKIWKETQPLFLQLASLLPKLQQDPTPLTHFIIKLAVPYRFEDIKEVEFEIGLNLEATLFHSLILTLLGKAAAGPSDAAALANRPGVIYAIVRLWLCSPDAGISTQASQLLLSLLRISKDEPGPHPHHEQLYQYGSAPIWKRLFHDSDIYSLYYHYTTFAKLTVTAEPSLAKRDRTIAQARLLEWLPHVGKMDWKAVTSSFNPELERNVGLADDQGLLHYASLKMVDAADDILMHMTLLSFYSDLITAIKDTPHLTNQHSSLSLDFLKDQGIHKQIIEFHTSDSPGLEHSFLSSRTAHYISEYASTYPVDFEQSPEMQSIRQYIHRNISRCEPNDLSVLASMPRATLVPRKSTGLAWNDAVLLDIPISRTNPDALKTLATVFHGPPAEPITFPQPVITSTQRERNVTERVFARLLTALYYSRNTSFFTDIVKHADLIAMKENALAALTLLRSIITSSWDTQASSVVIEENDPIYQQLQQFPKTGVDAVLEPSISGGVLPYLMKPATTFSNLVGGRGDAENAAYQVAMAKFDVLQALGERLEKDGGRQDVIAMIRKRVAEGPWGVGGSAGSRIGTLEL